MNKSKYGFISGILVIVTTIILYTLLVENFFKIPMAYITLVSVLVSEAIATVALFFANGYKSTIIASVFGAHALVLIVISIFYINIFPFAFIGFSVVYLLSLVAAILPILWILQLRPSSKEFQNAKINMSKIRALVNSMINSDVCKAYREELKKLDENLRFSDDSVVDEMDKEIEAKITMLSERVSDPDFDVLNAISDINNVIKQRNFVVKNKKSYNA